MAREISLLNAVMPNSRFHENPPVFILTSVLHSVNPEALGVPDVVILVQTLERVVRRLGHADIMFNHEL